MRGSVGYYLGSKIFAAALNLIAAVLFIRLAGPTGYGQYLIILAWAYIVYGFCIQWVRFTYFASFEANQKGPQITTLFQYVAVIAGLIAVGAVSLGLSGKVSPAMLASVASVVIALACYETSWEVVRLQLKADRVAVATVLRAIFILLFGITSLYLFGTPVALATAVAAAHFCAMVPLFQDVLPFIRGSSSRKAALDFLRYGWPLIVAYGFTALGQNIDRLLLGALSGPDVLGPYGAVLDLTRQSLFILGEAIAGASMAIAKQTITAGEHERARYTLSYAFRALAGIASFGAFALLRFGDFIILLLFGPTILEQVQPLAPYFVGIAVVTLFRSFYFGQVIFFARSSSLLELAMSAATLIIICSLSLLLIPNYGSTGAAAAVFFGNLASLILYGIASRRFYAMPLPIFDLLCITGYAFGAYVFTGLIDSFITPRELAIALDVGVYLAAFAIPARQYNLFGL